MAQPSFTASSEPRHDVLDRRTASGTAAATASDRPMPSSTFVDLAADHDGVRRRAAERGQAGEHRRGIHRVCVETDSRRERFVVGLEDVQGAGRPAVGQGVDEHQRLAPVEQVVGQVHAPDSVVHHPDSRACDVVRGTWRITSGPKPSSPRKMLPIPATRIWDVIAPRTPSTCAASSGTAARPAGSGRRPPTAPSDNDARYDGGRDTYYFHVELLSLSGSTSSGAKYR